MQTTQLKVFIANGHAAVQVELYYYIDYIIAQCFSLHTEFDLSSFLYIFMVKTLISVHISVPLLWKYALFNICFLSVYNI